MSKNNQDSIVSNQELLISNMLEIQAIIRILEKKGLITRDEILKEIEQLKNEMDELIRQSSKQN